ncbi:hypothetical protein TREPR_0782 [Treponema primitia ZAS-2]|uniref:Uncharacterized protein n=1 Tax=Treponema primitia (strain ATCC BAA-887 / DSM 12427 / ZAS-2) TaxID=545694 RepID=F5YJB1_TREPZ|nr:hypothetical protein [Treponema primitia]AEF86631.1 hypothetical protein TREPR_0782 [Treponema primitia ZAS-2]
MLVDTLETHNGLSALSKLPRDYIERWALKIPENLRKLLQDVVTVLLDRLEVPRDELREITRHITGKEDQMLFDRLVNSILEERRQDREEALVIGRNEGREETREQDRKYFLDLLERYTPEQIKAKLQEGLQKT